MAKKKKSKQKTTLTKWMKPYLKDNRVLFSILGAAGMGVAIASVIGIDRFRMGINPLTGASPNRPSTAGGAEIDQSISTTKTSKPDKAS
jgi:hypothetical protein